MLRNEELKAYSIAIINCIKELMTLNPLFKEELALLISKIDISDPGTLADFSAAMTTASREDLIVILETLDVRERVEHALNYLKRELEIMQLQSQINKRIESRLSKQQREFFLREQFKEIKKELGLSKEGPEAEVEKFEKRLEALTLTPEAEERIQEELSKLRVLESSSPEYGISRNYLDWLTLLPWGIFSEDAYDLPHALKILNNDHYGLDDVKDYILELIAVGKMKGSLSSTIILLVGPPGVGKTSIGHSIAKSLGREFYRFSLGGMRDEAEIKGHRRTYIGAMPGKLLQALKTCKTNNPVIMLDEVDKIGASFRGDPASALLEVLDPEQNKDFLDHYLDVRFDLSKILFICTANQLDSIPDPLLDRMDVIRLAGYVLEEKRQIAERYLIPKQQKLHGLQPKQVEWGSKTLIDLIDGYSREAGVRGLEQQIKKIMRKSAKILLEERKTKIVLHPEDLPDLLGERFFRQEKLYKKPQIGVVMGLAYTSLGGSTLYIESIATRSKSAGYKQTGQLGKVMLESAEIAYTFVKSLLESKNEIKHFFDNHLIHLHVPAGATPKDGPSAGITMACAIYSLVTQKPFVEGIAMTGELSLTGSVMPIGGVKEKIIAAKRANVSTVLLPKDNQEEFEKLSDTIKQGLSVHFVKNFKEVIKICL